MLEEVLRWRPRSCEELIEIRGIGPAFCEKHGESLQALTAWWTPSLGIQTASSRADVAQLVEHFTRNEGVRGSSPRVGLLTKWGAHGGSLLPHAQCWGPGFESPRRL